MQTSPLDLRWLSDLPPSLWVGLTVASALIALTSVVLAPRLLVRLPADYAVSSPPSFSARRVGASPLALLWLLLRNGLGLLLLLLGLLMLFTPGQGLLTLIAGLALVDLPGRHALLVALLRRPSITRAVQRLRARAGAPPLIGLPPSAPPPG